LSAAPASQRDPGTGFAVNQRLRAAYDEPGGQSDNSTAATHFLGASMLSSFHRIIITTIALAVLLAVAGCGSDSVTGPGDGLYKRINGDNVEIRGFIETILERQLVVFDTEVVVGEMTRIMGDHGEEVDFSDLLVGMLVTVQGTLIEGQAVLADEITVEVRNDGRSTGRE
jgi:hypothetical protein